LPHLDALYRELKDHGFDLLAVNHGDAVETIRKFAQEKGFALKMLLGGRPGAAGYGIFERYGVSAYPANYLLDAQGRVVWRRVGFEQNTLAELRAALAKLGVK